MKRKKHWPCTAIRLSPVLENITNLSLSVLEMVSKCLHA